MPYARSGETLETSLAALEGGQIVLGGCCIHGEYLSRERSDIQRPALGLLTGMVQAYIFSILAAVYIAAATRSAGSSKADAKPGAAPSA